MVGGGGQKEGSGAVRGWTAGDSARPGRAGRHRRVQDKNTLPAVHLDSSRSRADAGFQGRSSSCLQAWWLLQAGTGLKPLPLQRRGSGELHCRVRALGGKHGGSAGAHAQEKKKVVTFFATCTMPRPQKRNSTSCNPSGQQHCVPVPWALCHALAQLPKFPERAHPFAAILLAQGLLSLSGGHLL